MSFIKIAILFAGLACVSAQLRLPPVAENQVPPEGGKIMPPENEAEKATPRFLGLFPDFIMKPIARTIRWVLDMIFRVIGRILSFLLPDKIMKEMLPPELHAFIKKSIINKPRSWLPLLRPRTSYVMDSGEF